MSFCAICRVNWAQNGYNYDRPDLSLGIASTSLTGFAGTSDYPSSSGFGSVTGSSPPVYKLGSTVYPSGRPSGPNFAQSGAAGLTGSAEYPIVGTTGSGASSVGGTGFHSIGAAPSFPGNSAIPTIGFLSTSEGQQRPSEGISSMKQHQTGPSADFFSRPSSTNDVQYEDGSYSAIPGEQGVDYPIFSVIPETSFDCNQQLYPGYYADIETQCQVFHICALNKTFNFLCPNGTIFSQEHFVCVWWNQFECASAPGLFEKNTKLYNNPEAGRQSSDVFTSIQTSLGLSGPSGPTAGGAPYTGRLQGGLFSGASVGQQDVHVGSHSSLPHGSQGSGSSYSVGLTGGYPGSRSSVIFQPEGQIPFNVSTGYIATGGQAGLAYPSGSSQQGYPGPSQSDEQYALSPQIPTREYLPPKQG
ncbi:uncharacterized protein LOC135714707 [Ochlerotatus camptorhynchus]|uniref:uncharacterized protein LOC135714707 n=1 Tax=Ochlerotatus camptorhynchus TaxID=644619 RepID=UPI0031E03F5C